MASATLTPVGHRSSTAYSFSEEEADAIVRVTTDSCQEYRLAVLRYSPDDHRRVCQSIPTAFQRTSPAGLGSLSRLPLELVQAILLQADMHSLFRFRQVNLFARQAVGTLRQYELVAAHGLNLFCGLLRTRLAQGISLLDFYEALCTKACAYCGNFGVFMSLLTWNRCCFVCLQEAPELQVQSLAIVRKQFRLTRAEASQLTSFQSVPGIYTMEEQVYKARTRLVSIHQARLISGREPPADASGGCYGKYNFMATCPLPYYDRQRGKAECGRLCAGCQLAFEKDIIGSEAEEWAFDACDKVYAQNDFLEHFQWCEEAQLLWTLSDKGRKKPAELPEVLYQ